VPSSGSSTSTTGGTENNSHNNSTALVLIKGKQACTESHFTLALALTGL